MRNRVTLITLVIALGLIGAGCTKPSTPAPAPSPAADFGTTMKMNVGATTSYSDGLQVTLVQINDSRCAPGNTCIWQGELSPVLHVSGGNLTAASDLTLGTERAKEAVAGPYMFKLDAATVSDATVIVVKKTQ